MLTDVLGRDGAELAASEIRRRNLANADHLATSHVIWAAETRAARDDRYRELVVAVLPPDCQQDLSPRARWLFRILRAADLAGLDPAEVVRAAIASRDLAGVRDVAAVLDARIASASTRCSPSLQALGPAAFLSCPIPRGTPI